MSEIREMMVRPRLDIAYMVTGYPSNDGETMARYCLHGYWLSRSVTYFSKLLILSTVLFEVVRSGEAAEYKLWCTVYTTPH